MNKEIFIAELKKMGFIKKAQDKIYYKKDSTAIYLLLEREDNALVYQKDDIDGQLAFHFEDSKRVLSLINFILVELWIKIKI